MNASPAPGAPQTALKAHIAGLLTLLAGMALQYLSGRMNLDIDPTGALAAAFAESAAAGAVAWLGAYLPANSPK